MGVRFTVFTLRPNDMVIMRRLHCVLGVTTANLMRSLCVYGDCIATILRPYYRTKANIYKKEKKTVVTTQ